MVSGRNSKFKYGVLRPVQQPGLYWDGSSVLPLVGVEPTHRGHSLWLDAKLANPLGHRRPQDPVKSGVLLTLWWECPEFFLCQDISRFIMGVLTPSY